MRKPFTFIINDIIWIVFSVIICLGGLQLGFGSFGEPKDGFMFVLCGLVLGLLASLDLISGFKAKRIIDTEKKIWTEINWPKVLLFIGVLFIYVLIFPRLGFVVSTFILLIFLYRVIEPRKWWIVIISSIVTTAIFYFGFKIGLEAQLPAGFIGL